MYKINELTISKWVTEATGVAARVVKDKVRLKVLLIKATKMVPKLSDAAGDAKTLIRLVKACVKGEYTELPKTTMLLVVGALVYLVAPLDILPDPILIDDGIVIGWVVSRVRADLERFRVWEEVAQASSVEDALASVVEDALASVVEVAAASAAEVERGLFTASVEPGLVDEMPADQQIIASLFLTDSTMRQLILQSIPPKVRSALRDLQVFVNPEQIRAEIALSPVGHLTYEVSLPTRKVALRRGELKLIVKNITPGPVGRRVATALKLGVDRMLTSPQGLLHLARQGDEYTIRWEHLLDKIHSFQLNGFALTDLVTLEIRQEAGRIRVDVHSALG